MKPSREVNLSLKLQHYLGEGQEALWVKTTPTDWIELALSLFLAVLILIANFRYQIKEALLEFWNGNWAAVMVFIIFTVIIGLYIGIPTYKRLLSEQLIVGYTKDYVFFIQGGRKKKIKLLHFKDIKDIRLVGYNNKSTSTIYFLPAVQTPYRGFNEDRQEERIYPTFEEVENGQSIYQELKRLLVEAHKVT